MERKENLCFRIVERILRRTLDEELSFLFGRLIYFGILTWHMYQKPLLLPHRTIFIILAITHLLPLPTHYIFHSYKMPFAQNHLVIKHTFHTRSSQRETTTVVVHSDLYFHSACFNLFPSFCWRIKESKRNKIISHTIFFHSPPQK